MPTCPLWSGTQWPVQYASEERSASFLPRCDSESGRTSHHRDLPARRSRWAMRFVAASG